MNVDVTSVYLYINTFNTRKKKNEKTVSAIAYFCIILEKMIRRHFNRFILKQTQKEEI